MWYVHMRGSPAQSAADHFRNANLWLKHFLQDIWSLSRSDCGRGGGTQIPGHMNRNHLTIGQGVWNGQVNQEAWSFDQNFQDFRVGQFLPYMTIWIFDHTDLTNDQTIEGASFWSLTSDQTIGLAQDGQYNGHSECVLVHLKNKAMGQEIPPNFLFTKIENPAVNLQYFRNDCLITF